METKNCIFQYATQNKILADTDLITKAEAVALFDKNKDDFIERMELEEEPEMCVWINCKDNDSYGEQHIYWHSSELLLIDGELWSKS